MKAILLDLFIKTTFETKVFRALTDKEIVLMILERELKGDLVSWIAKPTANPGRPIERSAQYVLF